MKNVKGSPLRLLLGVLGLAITAAAGAAPPNVLIILSDDQRFDTIAALGNSAIRTPSLDRLADRAFVLDHVYNFGGNTPAVCVPARNMLMTGKNYFHLDRGAHDSGAGTTLPKSFAAAGYETYYAEKSSEANLPFIKKQFDHAHDIHQVNALASGYAAKGAIDGALQFLAGGRDVAKPFFMYLGLPCPHDPRWSAREFRDLYDPAKLPLPPNYLPAHPLDIGDMTGRDESLEAWPRTEAAVRRHLFDYYALITDMDRDIGRLLDLLDRSGLATNTIVVFSSDQGIALGSHGLFGKQNLYEDTQRVPFLIAGPGIRPGRSGALAYLHDLFPTLCELAGLPPPADIQGRSFAPVLRGEATAHRETLRLAYGDTQRSMREARWKLIRYPQINRQTLFDLQNDPREMHDLAADPQHASMIGRLSTLLKAEQRLDGDCLPLVSRAPQPAAFTPPDRKLPTPWPAGGLAPGVPVQDPQTGARLGPFAPRASDAISAQEMLKGQHGRFTVVYPPRPETESRLAWFKEAKFGMFIHWGIYSRRGGIAPNGQPQQHGYTEWYQKANRMSHAEYAKLAAEFNPRRFDAERWVLTAKQTGMRYVTFTSKHHDGFCMFDSAHTRYDVADATPFGRDVVKELREACDRHGLKLCLYYSHCQDWEQWDAWQTPDWIYPEKAGTPVDHERYLAGKCLPQVEELCRKYRPDGLWFDTPWFNEQKLDRGVSKRISDAVRRLAPGALINSRLAHGSDSAVLHADLFDYLTLGDQALPDADLPLYAESPDSVTVSYGFDARPRVRYRGAPELIRRMILTVAGGGNYLLNVGPDGEGEIPPQAAAELKRVGAWLETNGEAIHGAQANPWGRTPVWGEVTSRGGALYLFPLRHHGGELIVSKLTAIPVSLCVLGGAEVAFSRTADGIRFTWPADNPASTPSVLRLECKQEPVPQRNGEASGTRLIGPGIGNPAGDSATGIPGGDINPRGTRRGIGVKGLAPIRVWHQYVFNRPLPLSARHRPYGADMRRAMPQ